MTDGSRKLRVAILGSGNIGSDLLSKVMRSDLLECTLFIGRNFASKGMVRAASLGVPVSDQSIDALVRNPGVCDLVFDATSALSHTQHAAILEQIGMAVIDLTPSNIGRMCIPAVNLEECLAEQNVNMVTCGGQGSIPLARVIGNVCGGVEYIEVVSQIASRSAGPATRVNIDEYIGTTERGIRQFSDCLRTKAILNLNPANPPVNMQVSVLALVREPNLERLGAEIDAIVKRIQTYVPGYALIVPPMLENGRLFMMVGVRGRGDYLPAYAGNLDIINCAAIAVAEGHARLLGDSAMPMAPGLREGGGTT
ncbi:MAG: acetaldehyde dehydrogenase (acetylating) [Coriobacteriia bacterium]|nr:acetaldehyde dehydrogenase (acetylating) [Coriobacteriia bacterium]